MLLVVQTSQQKCDLDRASEDMVLPTVACGPCFEPVQRKTHTFSASCPGTCLMRILGRLNAHNSQHMKIWHVHNQIGDGGSNYAVMLPSSWQGDFVATVLH